jgi:cytochrome P450
MTATAAPKSIADRITGAIGNFVMGHIDLLFRISRSIMPILVLPRGGKKLVIVTRYDDVQEVLKRNDIFNVIYAPKIRVIMDGDNIFLGSDEPQAVTDKATLRKTAPPAEAMTRVKPQAEQLAEEVMAKAPGRIEVTMDLTQQVTTRFFGDYFGTPGRDITAFSDQARLLFRFMFADLDNDPALLAKAKPLAADLRTYVEGVIAARKQARKQHDDILERCLEMQDQDPAITDRWIRNNIIGLIVGALPQAPMLIPKLINVLMDRPAELAAASAAARSGDDELLAKYVFEASRYDPLTPFLFRECVDPYTVAAGTWRAKQIPKGAQVFAAVRSAMFDARRVGDPAAFRLDRPQSDYFHFGFGMHECFGIYMNKVMVPAICKALLKRSNLRRASGEAGRLQMDGPFPTSLVVEFDR